MLNLLTDPASQPLLSHSLLLSWLEIQCATNSHCWGTLFDGLTAELAYIQKMPSGSKDCGKHYWETQMIDCESCRPGKLTELRDLKRHRVNTKRVGKRLTPQKWSLVLCKAYQGSVIRIHSKVSIVFLSCPPVPGVSCLCQVKTRNLR